MTTRTVRTRGGVSIRLPDERWAHIVEEHAELAGMREDVLDAVQTADRVLAGNAGEQLAVRRTGPDRALVVVYREIGAADGFVITAFVTSRLAALERREQLWPPST